MKNYGHGCRFIERPEYNSDIAWANSNFINLDAKDMDQKRAIDNHSKRLERLEKKERSQNRFDILHFLLTGLIGYVVIKHDQILDEHRRRIDRLEEIMRMRREQGKES